MKEYLIYLPSGDVRTVRAETMQYRSLGSISFYVGNEKVAEFFTDRICGWMLKGQVEE